MAVVCNKQPECMSDKLGYLILIIDANMDYVGEHGWDMIVILDKEQLQTKRLCSHIQTQICGICLSQARQKLIDVAIVVA